MRRPVRTALTALATTAVLVPLATTAATATPGGGHGGGHGPVPDARTLVPVGGGYETPTLEGFARVAMYGASGPTVDIVVVPSSYGDAPEDREENLELAQERTDQVDAACDAVVQPPYTGCTATLAVLLDRADALDPANSAGLRDPGLDGVYILGGDQGIAMDVLAESPAEDAMAAAFRRGVAVGGTSAGAAVESRNMINGYVGDLGPAEGLQRDSTLMWWGDDADRERGLSFGSARTVLDQHFYQRGRFGRLLSTLATSDERFGGRSLLGVGVDYATGVELRDDRHLTGVFGASSVAVVDLETLRAQHRWVGPRDLLSLQGALVHLLPPGDTAYDVGQRRVSLAGRTVRSPHVPSWHAPSPAGRATVYLGGDVSSDFTSGVVPDFVTTVKSARGGAKGPGRIVVLVADRGGDEVAQEYAAGLRAAGWTGDVVAASFGGPGWATADVCGAAGVVVVAQDPTLLGDAMADRTFRSRVTEAVRSTPAVLADRHMAAALGTAWSPRPDPTDDDYEDVAIANFRTDDAQFRPGLGLVRLGAVPTLTYDYRWGRLFALGQRSPGQLAVGVGEDAALVLSARGARVVGDGSVAVLDSSQASYWTAANGAIGAVNTVLSTFAPGDEVRPRP